MVANIFLLLVLLTPLFILLGLVKPALVLKWWVSDPNKWTRSQVLLRFGGLLVLFFISFGITSEKKQPAPNQNAAVDVSRQNAADSAQPKAVEQNENDGPGTQKFWGDIDVTMKSGSIRGNTGSVVFVLKNQTNKAEPISSIMLFGATSDEGDIGEFNLAGTECDGTIPPNGVLKCRLSYNFESPPKQMTVRVGAGMLTKSVFFKVGKSK